MPQWHWSPWHLSKDKTHCHNRRSTIPPRGPQNVLLSLSPDCALQCRVLCHPRAQDRASRVGCTCAPCLWIFAVRAPNKHRAATVVRFVLWHKKYAIPAPRQKSGCRAIRRNRGRREHPAPRIGRWCSPTPQPGGTHWIHVSGNRLLLRCRKTSETHCRHHFDNFSPR